MKQVVIVEKLNTENGAYEVQEILNNIIKDGGVIEQVIPFYNGYHQIITITIIVKVEVIK